ncbi:hypothetical protein C173_05271 [Paenibacillus sp. FSL R7-277]|uniref:hypothetical protein n=1 Tax=unclassified Paenibacillus TaxID=185978 RepID=UPI0003E259D9|nr:hypothetical protein [Paenibacillus sp. FSL R7-277]ETT77224.1 hypothetical protein C173_05271 [Paenibacillus sp. FSL R7-277]
MRMPSDSELTLLLEGDEQQLEQFAFAYSVIVDWREEDEEIVRLFGKRLPDETVEVMSTDKGLDVTYNGQLHSIALTFSGDDRYITIRGFQELIRDKYEIRLFEASYFSDTHEFLILPKRQWEELDARYPVRSREIFRVIDVELDFP